MSDKTKTSRPRLLEHDTSITLGNPRLVFKTFMECLEEGDAEAALEVLAGGLRYLNKSHLERRYHIPRRTVYNLLGKKSVPTLELIAKACRAIREEHALKERPSR